MGEIIKACGIAIIGVCFGTILKRNGSSIGAYLPQICAVSILITAITSLSSVIKMIKGLSGTLNQGSIGVLLSAAGIAIVARIIGDICKENGETMLKNAIDIAANVQITLLTLPYLKVLFDQTLDLVK